MGVQPGADPRQAAIKDGREWRIGPADDVAWITMATTLTNAITGAIPPIFEGYATVRLPYDWQAEQAAHDAALIDVLRACSRSDSWWLGYLDTGVDDLVFPHVPEVTLYLVWPYVLVEAGADQAATWRHNDGIFKGSLPNLIFPADRSWLVSTLWDDWWTCVGGPAALVEDLVAHPVLGGRARVVTVEEDRVPPGYEES